MVFFGPKNKKVYNPMDQAERFGAELQKAWDSESKVPFSEVQQFRALMRCFTSMKKSFLIEEFHGMKHQVIFNGSGPWGRIPARCEISDLLIVAYKKAPQFQGRLTFLQAKKSNLKHGLICESWDTGKSYPTTYKANLEQWDLLRNRPDILPHPPFKCDPKLLSDAILPSVGSFGVFHKINGKSNFFYHSADIANPVGIPSRKHSKLQVSSVDSLRNTSGYNERVFACCIYTFGMSLYQMEIGTPIDASGVVNGKDAQYRKASKAWIKWVLRSHLNARQSGSDLLGDLEEGLSTEASDDEPSTNFQSPPSVLVIRVESRDDNAKK